MAQLDSLPAEIVNHLLGFIPRSDLVALSYVSQALRRSAEPFLYANIAFDWDYRQVPPVVPLLRTLLRRPELFAYIDSVTMVGNEFAIGTRPKPLDPTKMPLDSFQAAIEKTQVPYTSLWIEQLKSGSGSMDALIGLFIANLCKIRFLAITHNFISGFQITSRVLQSKILGQIPNYSAVFGQLPRFEQLNRLIYYKERSASDIGIFPEVMSLFYLPTASDLVVNIPNPQMPFEWPAGEPDLSHLTSLEVDWVYPRCLAEILEHTRNLKTLYWNWQYNEYGTERSGSLLDYDHITTALIPLRRTLERFHFRLEGSSLEYIDEGIATTGSWDGLHDFERLVHLDVPLISLTGVDVVPEPMERHIPPSVETLCLTPAMLIHEEAVLWVLYPADAPQEELEQLVIEDWHPEGEVIKPIKALAENCPQALPRLRRIDFLGEGGTWNRRMDTLMSEANLEYDVELRVTHEEDWHKRHLPDYVFDI
ncbi:unnamed protein product [Clonostachys rhizophaga]|uniref:F-box domain-containing protein n=1 Tax=Clonostachys rhizophaga TaxID=160324 RepID=A0A9N9VDU7_9HYPO|nr:unnamed protein product [Clonostachys rhizophaga]